MPATSRGRPGEALGCARGDDRVTEEADRAERLREERAGVGGDRQPLARADRTCEAEAHDEEQGRDRDREAPAGDVSTSISVASVPPLPFFFRRCAS